MKKTYNVLFALGITLMLFSNILLGQTEADSLDLMEHAPKIFIDYNKIDMDYVRREVQFVNYVTDRKLADIYILVTRKQTGSGGREYTLTFIGHNVYESIKDTLEFYTEFNDTEDIVRSKFVKTLKHGLFPYMIDTPLINQFDLKFLGSKEVNTIKDKWDYWVFKVAMRGGFSGEEYIKSYHINGDVDADRITEEWKIRLNAGYNYDEDNYTFDDTEPYLSNSRSWNVRSLTVKSLSDHWSLGTYLSAYSSTYRNIDLSYRITPAIEFNFFPYSESTYRELRLNYSIGYVYNYYNELTIYDKMEEGLFRHSLELNAEVKQPWGEIDFVTEYSSYLHDLSKNRFQIYMDISLNLFKGFAFSISGGYSLIHDQISLPAEDMDLEDILLRRSELATQYDYWFRYGISYTFGSIYNNIVNPRF